MRSFLIFIAFLLAAALTQAQHNHFIYLQSDNKQPFYVKLKGNVYSSSASGYLIISKLQAGTHELAVGFPKDQWPLQTIPVTISGKDMGYLLKNFESKGWGLFNIQTMDIIMASTAAGSNTTPANTTQIKQDDFSNALADVVNTPSIKEVKKEAAAIEEKKTEPVKKEETVVITPVVDAIEPANTTEKTTEEIKVAAVKPASVIKKIRSTQTGEDTNITYLISDEYGSDTVDIVIPVEKSIEIAQPKESAVTEQITQPTNAAKQVEKKQEEPKFIDIDMPKSNSGEAIKQVPAAVEEAAPVGSAAIKMINSDCKSIASEDDFMKARKKMTAQKSDDEMVNAARKLFRQKCYSTAQVKNLSVLFLKDEGKYKFFDAIYPFVYDSGEFKLLESQLTDEYYISRFRSMIRK